MSSMAHSHKHTKKVAELRSATKEATSREPLGHLLVERLLREAGFAGDVSTSAELLDAYSTDESIFSIRPQVVLQPKDARDIGIAVTVLGREAKKFPNISLTPRAAGTGLGGGSLTDSMVLDVKKYMNRVLRVGRSRGRVTFTAEAGAWWRDVEQELKRYDSYLPPYPASKQICTIGGAVANNSAGPDSLRYGHVADWVESLSVVLYDGKEYDVRPLNYKELKDLTKKKNAFANIAREVFALIETNEASIKRARPKTAKNSAGYALWDVLNVSVAEFKKGEGTFDLTRLFSGSQGTIGVITKVTMRTEPIAHDVKLVSVPVFDLASAGRVVLEAIKWNPINVEVFDALTYQAALKHTDFFHARISGATYWRVWWNIRTNYYFQWKRKLPEFVLLITIDPKSAATSEAKINEMVAALRRAGGNNAKLITKRSEREMLWQVRDASFLLSKLLEPNKRPAAFLEDMTIPPEHLAKFFADIKYLLRKYNVTAAVHGHGGNAHFHFYPLLDFTNKSTPDLIVKMADEFFTTAIKYGGNLCGEHNDGIIRTPYLPLMFSKKILRLFTELEHIFDPNDIFNPGKKVNPRFDIKSSIRKKN